MSKRFHPALSVLALLLILSLSGCEQGGATKAEPSGEPVRIGFMICNSRSETEARFRPLVAYIGQKLGRRFEAVTIDTVDVEQAVRDRKVEFTHTNSLLYVILNKHYGVEPLAGDVQGKHGFRTNGGIVVMADSPIMSVSDLKGKRMVFGPMFAPTGYLSQYDYMLKQGFDPETGLAFYTIPRGSFKHEKVIYALMFGAFDAASVPMLDFEQMSAEGKIDPAEFRVLAETEPIPYCTFAATEQADDALAAKIRETLLAIGPEDTVEVDGERVKVLKAAGLDGFAPVRDSDYDIVRDMAKNCNMPPYQKY